MGRLIGDEPQPAPCGRRGSQSNVMVMWRNGKNIAAHLINDSSTQWALCWLACTSAASWLMAVTLASLVIEVAATGIEATSMRCFVVKSRQGCNDLATGVSGAGERVRCHEAGYD